MNKKLLNWLVFLLLSIIWGSSFILMKIGLQSFSAYQVSALRIFSAGLVLLPIAIKSIGKISLKELPLVILSGTLGNLIPAFLFCLAEQRLTVHLRAH